MKRPTRRALLVLAAALLGCSSAVVLCSTQPKPLGQRPPNVVATASASAVPAQALELDQFTPLLADARFHEIAEAVELAEFTRAAEALARSVKADSTLDSPSVEFWLGRLWERAGNWAEARAACERASATDGPLRDYAALCRARALIALGQAKSVDTELGARPMLGPPDDERRLLLARAARLSGDLPRAALRFREALPPTTEAAARARVELELCEVLLDDAPRAKENAASALALARRAGAVLAANRTDQRRAAELAKRALELLDVSERTRLSEPSLEERVLAISTLVDAREHERAASEARALLTTVKEDDASSLVCDARLLEAKALSSLRRFEAALTALAPAREHCASDPERGARAFYSSGRHAGSAGKYTEAIGFYEQVERRFPGHTLADDARFQAAVAQEELGVDARATELLLSLPDAYPAGDMVAEGLFRLSLRYLERAEWSTALGPLTRAISFLGDRDASRGFELSGRERFFGRARCSRWVSARARSASWSRWSRADRSRTTCCRPTRP
ncbi:MAG: tetratricopeptide repeat protein [Polyangiaceae bacterium]